MAAELGDYALVNGRVMKVVSINDQRSITFDPVDEKEDDFCLYCGQETGRRTINEGCQIWQQEVKPVPTIGGR